MSVSGLFQGNDDNFWEFADCTFYKNNLPLLVPNVVIGTENVVTHALPNLSEEKKEEEKRGGKEGSLLFLSGQVRQCMGDHILCAYYHIGHQ